jgi:hypothetical protein
MATTIRKLPSCQESCRRGFQSFGGLRKLTQALHPLEGDLLFRDPAWAHVLKTARGSAMIAPAKLFGWPLVPGAFPNQVVG